jgi:hypothetical protein
MRREALCRTCGCPHYPSACENCGDDEFGHWRNTVGELVGHDILENSWAHATEQEQLSIVFRELLRQPVQRRMELEHAMVKGILIGAFVMLGFALAALLVRATAPTLTIRISTMTTWSPAGTFGSVRSSPERTMDDHNQDDEAHRRFRR